MSYSKVPAVLAQSSANGLGALNAIIASIAQFASRRAGEVCGLDFSEQAIDERQRNISDATKRNAEAHARKKLDAFIKR